MKFLTKDALYDFFKPFKLNRQFWFFTGIIFSILQPKLVKLGHPPINGESYDFQQTTFIVLYMSWWMSSLICLGWAMIIELVTNTLLYTVIRLFMMFSEIFKKEPTQI